MSQAARDAAVKEQVVRTLESRGVLQKIRAQLRASVFAAIKENPQPDRISTAARTEPVGGILGSGAVVRDLVLEYLTFHGLNYSRDVLLCEANCVDTGNREQLQSRVGISDTCPDQPLLVSVLNSWQTRGAIMTDTVGDDKQNHRQQQQEVEVAAVMAIDKHEGSGGHFKQHSHLIDLPDLPGQSPSARGEAPETEIETEQEELGNGSFGNLSCGDGSFDMSVSDLSDTRGGASTTGISIVTSDHSADGSETLEGLGADYIENFRATP